MTETFLEEVEENLRSDRYRTLFRKYLPWVLGAAALVLAAALGFWGYDVWRGQQIAKASEAYAAAIKAAQAGNSAAAFDKFGEVTKLQAPAYKALALMSQGALRIAEDKTQEAVALYDKAAAATSDPVIKDAARLKSALALMDEAPYPAIEERLKPLLDQKRPYRMAAREALGMAKLQAGMAKAAREDFVVLTLAPGVPESMRDRAQAAMAVIDSGSAASLPAAVKAARAMPKAPPRAAPPPLPQAPNAGAAQ